MEHGNTRTSDDWCTVASSRCFLFGCGRLHGPAQCNIETAGENLSLTMGNVKTLKRSQRFLTLTLFIQQVGQV